MEKNMKEYIDTHTHTHMYTALYSRNEHNTVNQPYSNKGFKKEYGEILEDGAGSGLR